MTKITYTIIGLCAIGFIGLGIWFGVKKDQPAIYDEFATCLKDSGTKFFGTFWCPHCRNQKAMFGKSAKLLPYIECSTANGQGTLQICKDANITGYPTWVFPEPTITIASEKQPVECAVPYTKEQPALCNTEPVKGYKTFVFEKEGKVIKYVNAPVQDGANWVFTGETRLSGEIPLETLAEKTSCLLPTKQ